MQFILFEFSRFAVLVSVTAFFSADIWQLVFPSFFQFCDSASPSPVLLLVLRVRGSRRLWCGLCSSSSVSQRGAGAAMAGASERLQCSGRRATPSIPPLVFFLWFNKGTNYCILQQTDVHKVGVPNETVIPLPGLSGNQHQQPQRSCCCPKACRATRSDQATESVHASSVGRAHSTLGKGQGKHAFLSGFLHRGKANSLRVTVDFS